MSSFDPTQFTFPCTMATLAEATQQFAQLENSTSSILHQFQGLHGAVVPSSWQGTASQMAGASFEALGNALTPLMQYASSGSTVLIGLASKLNPLYAEFQSLILQGQDLSAASSFSVLDIFTHLTLAAATITANETNQQLHQITAKEPCHNKYYCF